MPSDDYPKRIPRERAVAALDLANAVLALEADLRAEEQPDGFNAGMDGESDTTTVEPETWQRWLGLARKAAEANDGGTADGN